MSAEFSHNSLQRVRASKECLALVGSIFIHSAENRGHRASTNWIGGIDRPTSTSIVTNTNTVTTATTTTATIITATSIVKTSPSISCTTSTQGPAARTTAHSSSTRGLVSPLKEVTRLLPTAQPYQFITTMKIISRCRQTLKQKVVGYNAVAQLIVCVCLCMCVYVCVGGRGLVHGNLCDFLPGFSAGEEGPALIGSVFEDSADHARQASLAAAHRGLRHHRAEEGRRSTTSRAIAAAVPTTHAARRRSSRWQISTVRSYGSSCAPFSSLYT